ncbi:MAG: hypothetical protein R6W66_01570 [Pelovirga sp.]
MKEETTAWICHICNQSSTTAEGVACSECFRLTCSAHRTTIPRRDHDSGLYRLTQVCVLCRMKMNL